MRWRSVSQKITKDTMQLVQNISYSPCVGAPHLFAPGEPQLARPVDLQVVCASVLGQIIAQRRLFPVFQPIAKLADGLVYAHEALIRGPEGGNLYAPDALFTQASEEALTFELELACLVVILQRWGELAQHGRLFINISAQALVRLISQVGMQPVIRLMRRWGISC